MPKHLRHQHVGWFSWKHGLGYFWHYAVFWLCRRPEDPQEEVPIFQISDPRTRKGILFQCVHQQRETHATVADAQPHRPTSEDLVSKPSHEGEEVEQRQVTVLHIQPSSLGVKSSTVLPLPSSAAAPTVFTDFPGCTLCSMQPRRCWMRRFKFEDMSFEFSKKKGGEREREKHELKWAIGGFQGLFFERKIYWILSLSRERKGLN